MSGIFHVERVEFPFIDDSNRFKELTDLGTQMFEFNARSHGDYEDIIVRVVGRFSNQHGALVFLSVNANGSNEMVGTNDLHLKVLAYYRFMEGLD